MSSAEDRLSDLLVEWQELQDQGQNVSAAALCADCPELAQELKRRIQVLTGMNDMLRHVQQENTCSDNSTRIRSAEPEPAVAGYQIVEELGRGGMGVVYRAWHLSLNRLVALKMGLPERVDLPRFRQEAEAAARLEHPNIVRIYDFGESEGRPYYSMECVDGGTLTNQLAGRPLPIAEAVALLETLARAMHYAHERRVVHRDLKPSNVLVADDGTLKIADFGLAKCLDRDQHLTASEAVIGSARYMAPEQAAGKANQAGPPADLFALGVIFYEMLTGRVPFAADTWLGTLDQVRTKVPEPVSHWRVEVPPALDAICLKCLEKEPNERYETALALAEDLKRFQAGEAIRVPRRRRQPFARWSRGQKGMAAGLLVGLVAIVATAATTGFLLPGDNQARSSSEEPADGAAPAERPEELPPLFTNQLGMKLVAIPAGTFTMGSPPQEIERCRKVGDKGWARDRLLTEGPEHDVEITRPFYMGSTEVTVGQFRQFVTDKKYSMGKDSWLKPGFEQADDHPVVYVSWNNAVDFCAWLSEKEKRAYRLPTEAEWEYCCRAGKAGTRYCFGDEDQDLGLYAWYGADSGGKTHPVGKLKPNAWGLYDMHGNAWEWCQDHYARDYYQQSPKQDPQGPGGGGRVIRGGSLENVPVHCRSAFRTQRFAIPLPKGPGPGRLANYIGFRVVLVPAAAGEH